MAALHPAIAISTDQADVRSAVALVDEIGQLALRAVEQPHLLARLKARGVDVEGPQPCLFRLADGDLVDGTVTIHLEPTPELARLLTVLRDEVA